MIKVEKDIITSRQNPTIVKLSKLQDRKYRKSEGLFCVDGEKLFGEAVLSGLEIKHVVLSKSYVKKQGIDGVIEKLSTASDIDAVVLTVDDGVFEKLTGEKSPQGIITVAKTIDFSEKYNKIYNNEKFFQEKRNTLMLCDMQNPGNLGTVLRCAAAFNIDAVYVNSGCSDLFSPKTVRGAMGALFKQPICIVDDVKKQIRQMREQGVRVYAAALDRNAVGLDKLTESDKSGGVCYVIGNEGSGLPDDIIAETERSVFIPMCENTESLNASIASAILMWELFKDKRK